jgi:heme A synthase
MATFLRFTIGLQTLAVFFSSVTAGLLLTTPNGHSLHSAAAYTVFVVAVVHVVAAVLVWRPGGGSPRPILYAVVFLGLTLAQVALGIAHVKTVHVPLGVLMFGFSLLQLSRAWSGRVPLTGTGPWHRGPA